MKYRYPLFASMFSLFLIGALAWFIPYSPQPSANKVATYALAKLEGTGTFQDRNELGGAHFSLQTVTIQTDDPQSVLRLKWNGVSKQSLGQNPRFRLSLASGLRTYQFLELSLPKGDILGTIDISMATSYQVFEWIVPQESIDSILEQGIEIRVKGKGVAVSFFVAGEQVPPALCPHLLIPGKLSPEKEFFKRFITRAGTTNYGWEGACVLDGLAALSAQSKRPLPYQKALESLLQSYFPEKSPLKTYPSVENTSCVAQLAFWQPKHPEIANVLAFWQSRKNGKGEIIDHRQTAAEGNYTVAWPLAVIAKQLNRPELAEEAIAQLRVRKAHLVDEKGAIWLRHREGGTPLRTYKLWSRGITWYFLGMAKTMDLLPQPPPDLIAEYQRTANYLRTLQDAEGMWHVFAEELETIPESSGTAGIATAMAIGIRRGWIGEEFRPVALKSLAALRSRLTPDGFLKSVAYCNRAEGGEEFQRKSKGSILQFGMGFYAQLVAELDPRSIPYL